MPNNGQRSKILFFTKEVDFDIAGPNNENEDNPKNKGKFFKIFFNIPDMSYYIKDLESGYGTFMRINKKYVI